MFALLAPYKLLTEVFAFCSLLAGVAFGIHSFLNHEQQIGYDRAVAEYNVKLISAQNAAIAQQAVYQKQIEDATNAAKKREQTIQTTTAAAATANDSLRDALTHIRDGVSSATAASLSSSVVALSTLFGECSSRYVGMAEKADRHSSDAQRIYDDWPVK